MIVLVYLSLCLTLHHCLPAKQSSEMEVMPKLQLAYLVEDGEYRQPESVQSDRRTTRDQRVKRQFAASETEVEVATAEQEIAEEEKPRTGRTSSFAADIARILAAAGGVGPTPIDPDARSYAGRKRRNAILELEQNKQHKYGLQEPHIGNVKVKSRGNHGQVIQFAHEFRKGKAMYLNGAKNREKRSDPFIPFYVYDADRSNTLKLEEMDHQALRKRLQIEREAQLARKAKFLKVQLTATQ